MKLSFVKSVWRAIGPFSILIGLAIGVATQAPTKQTALDRYIAQPDSVYGWKLVNTIEGVGYRGYVLELTSQTWRSEKDVDRPVWKHWLTIVKPEKITSNKALLFIGGGKNGDPAPTKAADRTAKIAVETGTVVADLGMVPNQPLFFTDSKDKGRSVYSGEAFFDQGRFLAGAAGNGQKRRARNGRDSGIFGQRCRRQNQSGSVRGRRRLKARLDYVVGWSCGQKSGGNYAAGD